MLFVKGVTSIFLGLFITSCSSAQQQSLEVKPKTTNEPAGLNRLMRLKKTQGSNTSDQVRRIIQDKQGFLWFATSGEGVYRYDGTSFIQFTEKDGLSSNKVWCIMEDSRGDIWLGTTNGLCRFNGTSFKAVTIERNFFLFNNDDSYYNDWSTKHTVWSMLEDKNGTIWIGAGDGVYRNSGGSFKRFLDDRSIINDDNLRLKMIGDIVEDKEGIIWFASGMQPGEEGICKFDGKNLTRHKPNGDGWIRNILEDKKGRIWLGTRRSGNFIYDGENFLEFTKKLGLGNPLLADSKGNIWFAGEEQNFENSGGIWCYDGSSFRNFTVADGIGKYSVWSMFEDKEGNLWIGTRNTGLYKFDGKVFTGYSE